MLSDYVIEISHAVPTDSYTWEVKPHAALLELKCISLGSLSAFLAACRSDLCEPLIDVRPSSLEFENTTQGQNLIDARSSSMDFENTERLQPPAQWVEHGTSELVA